MINSQIFLICHTITTRNWKMLMFLPDIMEAKDGGIWARWRCFAVTSECWCNEIPWCFFSQYHVMLNLRSGPILAASIKNRVWFQVTLCSKMTQCWGIILSVAQILIFCRFQHDCHTSPSPLLQSEKENRIWTKDKI